MNRLEIIKKDIPASIIVFLIALPLAIGISIACGLPIYSGIISAIIGGMIVGAFSGNSLQVSGPAAGLILVVVDILHDLGAEKLFLIVFLVGLIQILFGILSLGKWFRAISPAIIQGMLAGIGVSIFLSQFHIMLDSKPAPNFFGNISDLIQIIYHSVLPLDGSPHHMACAIGLITIAVIIFWNAIPNKKLKFIPSALVAVIIASCAANLMHYDINYITVDSNFWANTKLLSLNSFHSLLDLKIIASALIITFIASAETLLTSTAIDKMSDKSKTDYNKEIIAQGIGNSVSGIFGGLPITGVIVRSAANINAGAETRLSAMFHGFWILLFVTFFPKVLSYIPISSLAAILVYTGWKLIDIKAAKHLYSLSKGEFAIYMLTLVAILLTNLFEGIVIGFIAAFIKSAYKVMKINLEIEENEEENKIILKLHGNIIFLQLPSLIDALESLPEDKNIEICAEKLYFIDHACADFIKDWEKSRKNDLYITQVSWPKIRQTYPNFKWRKFHK